jgi:hypothetical protein
MDKRLIDFIQQHEDLIDDNDWEKVYKKASDELNADIGAFTDIMLEADIHPERYLKELPSHFLFRSTLKKFTIPDNIMSIGDHAFSYCLSLESIEIPNSVTSIGYWAFQGCSSLTSVTIPDSVMSIGISTFSNCSSLINVTIGSSVTSIGSWAFLGCKNLTRVTIPDSVTEIDDYAFHDCGDKLVTEYNGTKADWQQIYTPKAFEITSFTVNCTDGDVVKKRG